MAKARPTGTASAQASDTIWRVRLQDAEDKLVKDLRLNSDTVMTLCTEEHIIRDKDVKAFRRFRPDMRLKRIIDLVLHSDRQTYERFREILIKAKKHSLYKLLEIKENDEPEQRSVEAASQPIGPAHNEELDDIWRERLKDKEEALVDGLRLYPSTIVNKFKDEKIIKDMDILEIKKLSSEKQVRKIINIVLLGNRKTYETFRKILKECKLTALNDLLELRKDEPEQGAGKGEYTDLVNAVNKGNKKAEEANKKAEEANKKMDNLMNEMTQIRKVQSEEIEYLKTSLNKREQECIRLAKIIAGLRLKKATFTAKGLKTKGSRNEAKRLDDELDEKQKAFQVLEKERDDLRIQLQDIKMKVGSDITESRR